MTMMGREKNGKTKRNEMMDKMKRINEERGKREEKRKGEK